MAQLTHPIREAERYRQCGESVVGRIPYRQESITRKRSENRVQTVPERDKEHAENQFAILLKFFVTFHQSFTYKPKK